MDTEQHDSMFDIDSLYCQEEEKWSEITDDETQQESEITTLNLSFPPLVLSQQDLSYDDEELQSLKEIESFLKPNGFLVSSARKQSVEWILKVNSFYGFSALTAVLAVNYLDRFISTLNCSNDEPWMMQLTAVTCLSLAAKVEETQVPLLLDLQVEGTAKYVFEAKTVQKMELLVLSTLQWRMNPTTSLSFLDHIIRRLGLMKSNGVNWEFLRRCENLILSVIADSRFVHFLPSVLATATMLHVIHQVEICKDFIGYENQLLGVLKIKKEEVDDCYELISDVILLDGKKNFSRKRNFCQISSIPSGTVMDPFFSSDSSNDSWEITSTPPHHQQQPIFKKIRVQEQRMKLPSLSRVFVEPH